MHKFLIHKTLVQIRDNVNFDSLRFSFLQYMFSVAFNSKVRGDPRKHQASCDMLQYTTVFNKENKNAAVFKNVKVYAGDPWYQPANGYMIHFNHY